MKVLFITLDGLGDRPVPQLGDRTPLEAAHTPNLDLLASLGVNGLLASVAPGVAVGTPTAHALLLGYTLDELPGRAVFHAVARGLEPQPQEVVSLARFASVEPTERGLRLLQRIVDVPEVEVRSLAEAIRGCSADGVEVELVYTGESEGVLFLRGDVSDAITDCDPLGSDLPVIKAQPMEQARDSQAAARTARALNHYLSWAHQVLRSHPVNAQRAQRGQLPVNFLLAKWAGRRRPLPPFADRSGFKAVSVTSEEVLLGTMRELGVETRAQEEEETEQDLLQRLVRAKQLLAEGYDFVHVHTKQPDAIAHYADPAKKLAEIEALDRGFKYLVQEILPDRELVVAVSSDHSTPSVVSGPLLPGHFHDQHTGEPVPLVIVGRNALRDDVARFSERAATQGGLGLVLGKDFLNILLSQAERSNVIGWRPTTREVLYRPPQVQAFELGDRIP